MNVRAATELDLPAIVEIYNASIPGRMATADTEPVSVESRLAWFQQRDRATRPIIVMESTAKIVGWLSFQSFYGRPAYRATAELSLYVAPTHLRQGIGYRLLEYAIRRSPELGIETLLGFIFAHNEPSLKLFEKFGFQTWGYLPKVAKLDGIDRDLAILGLKVG
jgi:L-amino acid N-acyltransferase YncA